MFNSNLVLGAILVLFVLLVPKGLMPSIGSLLGRLGGRRPRPQERLHVAARDALGEEKQA